MPTTETTPFAPQRPFPGTVNVNLRGSSKYDVQRNVEAFFATIEAAGGAANFTLPIVLEDHTWVATGTVVLAGGGQ